MEQHSFLLSPRELGQRTAVAQAQSHSTSTSAQQALQRRRSPLTSQSLRTRQLSSLEAENPLLSKTVSESSKPPNPSPDHKSKLAISRPLVSTLIPRGIHGDRQRPDKPITHPSRKTKPGIPP